MAGRSTLRWHWCRRDRERDAEFECRRSLPAAANRTISAVRGAVSSVAARPYPRTLLRPGERRWSDRRAVWRDDRAVRRIPLEPRRESAPLSPNFSPAGLEEKRERGDPIFRSPPEPISRM